MAGSLTASRRPSSSSRRTPRQRVRQRQTLSEPIASAVSVTERSRPSGGGRLVGGDQLVRVGLLAEALEVVGDLAGVPTAA